MQEELAPWFEQHGVKPKWTKPESLRVGIHSLDGVDDAMINGICETVAKITTNLVPFKVSVTGLSCLPESQPRILAAKVAMGSELVVGLQKVLESHLDKLGIAKDDRGFEPMVVVGRLLTPRQAPSLPTTELGSFPFGESVVESVILLRHELLPRRVNTTVVRRFSLGPRKT
jgi:2'-5' RNA ligase